MRGAFLDKVTCMRLIYNGDIDQGKEMLSDVVDVGENFNDVLDLTINELDVRGLRFISDVKLVELYFLHGSIPDSYLYNITLPVIKKAH